MADDDLVKGIRESIVFLRMAAVQLRQIADRSEPEIARQLCHMADQSDACQRRREDASAGRSKNASRSGHPNSAFQFDQRACFPGPTWPHAGHGAQGGGWEGGTP